MYFHDGESMKLIYMNCLSKNYYPQGQSNTDKNCGRLIIPLKCPRQGFFFVVVVVVVLFCFVLFLFCFVLFFVFFLCVFFVLFFVFVFVLFLFFVLFCFALFCFSKQGERANLPKNTHKTKDRRQRQTCTRTQQKCSYNTHT